LRDVYFTLTVPLVASNPLGVDMLLLMFLQRILQLVVYKALGVDIWQKKYWRGILQHGIFKRYGVVLLFDISLRLNLEWIMLQR
jgi:hypothetical protein